MAFDLTFMGVFGRLQGLGSFECPQVSLACWQIFFPISFGGVGFISSKVIMLVGYLVSWAFLAFFIALKFLVYSCPFLLKVIRVSNSS